MTYIIFFFKQNTAYEMRIIDWSSDVCSSDLAAIRGFIDARAIPAGGWVVVWQYDDQKLAEKRHITRAELDAIAADRNIVVLHSSLHSLVANRSEERRVGKEWVRTGRSRWSPNR